MSKTRIVFVHGLDGFGAAAWPAQHLLAGRYDALFLKRSGFDAFAEPTATNFFTDVRIVADALGAGGHVVAHAQGAIAAMMAAVEHPHLVRSLTLVEPALTSLTAELPATMAYREHLEPLFARRTELSDEDFAREYYRLTAAPGGAGSGGYRSGVSGTVGAGSGRTVIGSAQGLESIGRVSARLRLQSPSWEAPLHIVPGVPTLVLTGGWEPLYEEVADYLATTGARHVVSRGGHRPQDTEEGAGIIGSFIAETQARVTGGQLRG